MPNLNLTVDGAPVAVPYDPFAASVISGRRFNGIKSFDVITADGGEKWRASVNKCRLLGIFHNQATALGAVVGAFICSGASSLPAIEASMSEQLTSGASTIDSTEPIGNIIDMTVVAPTAFATGVPTPGSTWLLDLFNTNQISAIQADASGLTITPNNVSPSTIEEMAALNWELVVDGQVFNVDSANVANFEDLAIKIADPTLTTFLLSADRGTSYSIADPVLTESTTAVFDIGDNDDWYFEEDSNTGWTYFQAPVFESDGAKRGWIIYGGDATPATSAQFLADYAAATGLPLGEQLNGDPVVANGWNNVPRYEEFDYPALVDYILDESGTQTYDDLGGVALNIDIEHGFEGYDVVGGMAQPGPYRGVVYWDPNNPTSPLNCAEATFDQSQKLFGHFVKLAELVRQGAVSRGASSPPIISWYNMPGIPSRVHMTGGQLDGQPRPTSVEGGRPNTEITSLSESERRTICTRILHNCGVLFEGTTVDGVVYPGLEKAQLLGFPLGRSAENFDEFQLVGAASMAASLKTYRNTNPCPPTEILTTFTISGKQDSVYADTIVDEATLIDNVVGMFANSDVSSWQVISFNWEQLISNTFKLNKNDWTEFSSSQKEKAQRAWSSIWETVNAEAAGSLPMYLPTANNTIRQANFTNNTTIRDQWWTTLRQFLGNRFANVMCPAAVPSGDDDDDPGPAARIQVLVPDVLALASLTERGWASLSDDPYFEANSQLVQVGYGFQLNLSPSGASFKRGLVRWRSLFKFTLSDGTVIYDSVQGRDRTKALFISPSLWERLLEPDTHIDDIEVVAETREERRERIRRENRERRERRRR